MYKARKTPTTIYPSSPPKVPDSIEVLYHSIDPDVLEKATAGFREKIVTNQILYKPAIVADARINFHGNRWQIHFEKEISRIISFPTKHQFCEWDTNLDPEWNHHHDSRGMPEPESFFVHDSAHEFSSERFDELQEDFRRHLISTVVLAVEYNPQFKLERKLDESSESFMSRCMERARADFDNESHNVQETLHRLQDRLKQRLEREERGANSQQQAESERHDSNANIGDIKKEMEALQILRKVRMNELEENLVTIAKERETDVLRIGRATSLYFALH